MCKPHTSRVFGTLGKDVVRVADVRSYPNHCCRSALFECKSVVVVCYCRVFAG